MRKQKLSIFTRGNKIKNLGKQKKNSFAWEKKYRYIFTCRIKNRIFSLQKYKVWHGMSCRSYIHFKRFVGVLMMSGWNNLWQARNENSTGFYDTIIYLKLDLCLYSMKTNVLLNPFKLLLGYFLFCLK